MPNPIQQAIADRKAKREREFRRGVTWVQVGIYTAAIWNVLKWIGTFFLIGAVVFILAIAKAVFGQR